jgi:hypothetical protein
VTEKCARCNGTGYASAFRDSGLPDDTPMMHRPIGVYQCPSCGGSGKRGGELSEEFKKVISDAVKAAGSRRE